MAKYKSKFVRAGEILSLFPMDISTLEKKGIAGTIERRPDPTNRQYFLYSVADAEREAPPTDDRVSQFKDDNAELWVWLQIAPKRYKKSIPTLYRWKAEGKIRIEPRQFAGTRGIRDFVNDGDMRRAIAQRDPMPAGYLTLEDTSIQRGIHEGTIRKLVRAKTVLGQRWRTKGRNGRTVSKMIVSTASMDRYVEQRDPERGAWVSANEAEQQYGFKARTLYTWHLFGCPYIAAGKLSTRTFRIDKTNGRACNVIHYLRTELELVKPAFFRAAERQYVAPDGRTYVAWDVAAKSVGIASVRLWAMSKTACEYLPGNRPIRSMHMPVRPRRATAKTMTVLGYDQEDIAAIRNGPEPKMELASPSKSDISKTGKRGRGRTSSAEANIRYAILADCKRAMDAGSELKQFCEDARSCHGRQISPDLIRTYKAWSGMRKN